MKVPEGCSSRTSMVVHWEQEVRARVARLRATISTSSQRQDASLHRRPGAGHNRRHSLPRRPAVSAAHSAPHVEADCPGCHSMNVFTAPATCPQQVTICCFSCSEVFDVQVEPPESRRLTDIRLCRNCGEINRYLSPDIGSPWPDVQCRTCGHILPGQLAQRRMWHQRRRSSPTQPMNAADESDIAALPVQKVRSGASHLGNQTSCTICIEDFKDGDDVKTLPCLHLYHTSCIDAWLRRSNDCPICKMHVGKGCRSSECSSHSSKTQEMAGSGGAF